MTAEIAPEPTGYLSLVPESGTDGATIDAAAHSLPSSPVGPEDDHPSNLYLVSYTLHDLAEMLDGVETLRIAAENRLRRYVPEVDADGIVRSVAIDRDGGEFGTARALLLALNCRSDVVYGDPAKVRSLGETPSGTRPRPHQGVQSCCMEHGAVYALERAMKASPLATWALAIPGVGAKQLARMLATIGDPYLRTHVVGEGEDVESVRTPRTVAQLWSYTGLRTEDGRGVRRARGVQANWTTRGKSQSWLVVVGCLKAHARNPNPYGAAYYDRKAATEGRLHEHPCAQCGGAGKAAEAVGEPWRDGHRHADALRIAQKALLRDLWREAKRLHEEP